MSADPKAPIERTSLKMDLEARYAKSDGQFKKAGTQAGATNFVDVANKFSDGFKIKDGAGFTPVAENYASNVLRLDTTQYAPSGRK